MPAITSMCRGGTGSTFYVRWAGSCRPWLVAAALNLSTASTTPSSSSTTTSSPCQHLVPRHPGSSGRSVRLHSGLGAVSSDDRGCAPPASRHPSTPGRGHPQLPPHAGKRCASSPLEHPPEGFDPGDEPRIGLEEVVFEIFIGDRVQDRRRAAVLRDYDVLALGQFEVRGEPILDLVQRNDLHWSIHFRPPGARTPEPGGRSYQNS